MAERRYTLVFYVAVLTAATATYGVYRVLQTTKERNRIVTQPVVIAARDLPEGAGLERLAVAVSEWPVQTVPVGAFAAVDSVIGRVTRVPIFKGEPIVPGRLAPAGTGPGLEVKITPGKRAMAVKINDVAGISGLILPNSRVDVLVTLRDDDVKQQVAKLFMTNMRVLSVGTQVQRGNDGKPIEASTATLEVTPDEAERLAIATRQGTIALVLRGYGDPDSIATPGARATDVLAQLRSAPTVRPEPIVERRPARTASRPARSAPPQEVPVQQVVVAPTPRPDTVAVMVYRGGKRTAEKVEKDSTAKRDSTSAGNGHNP